MATESCAILEAVKLDGVPLTADHAVLIIDKPGWDPSAGWHVAVLGLRSPPANLREGVHQLTARTARGLRICGQVRIDSAADELSYVCLRGVGRLSSPSG